MQVPEWLPWAVKFPQEIYGWPETCAGKMAAVDAFADALAHAVRIVEQVQKGNQQVIDTLRPMLEARHPSQLYAALMEGVAVFLVLLLVWRRPRKPGIVASWFAISYAVMRIIDELWRRPDVQLLDEEFRWLHITRGQWLSMLLLAVGVWGIWFSQRRATQLMGSWRRGPWTNENKTAEGKTDHGKPDAKTSQ